MTNDPVVEPGRDLAVPDAALPAAEARRWRAAALATAAVFLLNGTIIAAWIARLPTTRDRLDLDPRTIGVVLLLSGIGSLVAMPFVGRAAARFGSRPVVVVTATVNGLTLVALALTPDAVTTGAVLFLFGASLGSWDVAMNIQGSYVDRRAGRDYMPRYHACWSVGAAVGAGLGALAAGLSLSLTTHFTVAAVVGCGGAIVVALTRFVDDREPVLTAPATETVPDAAGTASAVRPRLLSRRLVLLGVITLCACLLEGAAADWLALYLTDERGAVAAVAAAGYGTWAAAMALSRFSGTTLIGRFGRARMIRTAGVVVLCGVLITLAAPVVGVALVGAVLWGAGVALVFPAAMSAGGETPGRAADGIAVVSTIGYGGFLVGPPLIGLLAHEVGIGRALWVLPVLCVGILLLAPVVKPLRTVDAR